MTSQSTKKYRIGKQQLALLEKLSNTIGISGDEKEIRSIVREQVKPLCDEMKVDAMGNLLVFKHAKVKNPFKVMMAAHMDEIGFMIVNDDGEGLFGFEPVGGIDKRQLLSKKVFVGKDRIPGIIGSKPIHLVSSSELEHSVSIDSMRIDVGPANASKVKLGDYAGFATKFQQNGTTLLGKALDDRLGVATLIELLKIVPENLEFLAAFTVQEEVGLRGAMIAAYGFEPDLAIVVDSTPAFDLPRPDGNENTQYNTRVGSGPAIYLADAGTLSDPRLIRFLESIAKENTLSYQFRQPGGGGTDAGAIHKNRAGIPSVSVSVPGRYAHTAVLLANLTDWENTIKLLSAALQEINSKTLAGERV